MMNLWSKSANIAKVSFLRNYATESVQNVRSTLKAGDSRKTYLVDMYTHLWRDNEIVLFAHHNNLLSTENESLRKQFKKLDAKNPSNKLEFRKLKGSIFRYFLRASVHEDPASKAAARMIKRKNLRHPLENLLKGPTAAILIKDLDPKLVKEVAKLLSSQKEKLFIMGGKVGDEIMTLDNIEEFKNMKSLPELRAELVGLLAMASGGGIVRTLESTTNSLAMTLESHKNELDKAENPESPEAEK